MYYVIAAVVLIIVSVISHRMGRKQGNYSGWCEGWNQCNDSWLDITKNGFTVRDSEASEESESVADPK